MKDFIVWLQDLTVELQKPRWDQEGLVWIFSALPHGFRDHGTTKCGSLWGGIKDSVDLDAWKKEMDTFSLVWTVLYWWAGTKFCYEH